MSRSVSQNVDTKHDIQMLKGRRKHKLVWNGPNQFLIITKLVF